MANIQTYCSVSDNTIQTFVTYCESYNEEFEMQLLALVGGTIGSGNFEMEWIAINFDTDGNPVNAAVGETLGDGVISDILRGYEFDQDAWAFNSTAMDEISILNPTGAAELQTTGETWTEFDDADQLVVTDKGLEILNDNDVVTIGDLDSDQLSWLSKVWSLKASF